jgi:hypothetical protein
MYLNMILWFYDIDILLLLISNINDINNKNWIFRVAEKKSQTS